MLKKQHKQKTSNEPATKDQRQNSSAKSGNRVDEVGHSGVYPQSGPHPKGADAPLRDQGSWGEGRDEPRSLVPNEAAGRSLDSSEGVDRNLIDEGRQGGQSRSPRTQERGANLDELYEENTEIRRETEFRDATAHPLDPDAGGPKVTRDNDLFGKERE